MVAYKKKLLKDHNSQHRELSECTTITLVFVHLEDRQQEPFDTYSIKKLRKRTYLDLRF